MNSNQSDIVNETIEYNDIINGNNKDIEKKMEPMIILQKPQFE